MTLNNFNQLLFFIFLESTLKIHPHHNSLVNVGFHDRKLSNALPYDNQKQRTSTITWNPRDDDRRISLYNKIKIPWKVTVSDPLKGQMFLFYSKPKSSKLRISSNKDILIVLCNLSNVHCDYMENIQEN